MMLFKKLSAIQIITIPFLLAACSSQPVVPPPPPAQPQVQQPQPPPLPDWVMNEPGVKEEKMYFVGISALYAREQGAREDALRNARLEITNYLGTVAKSKFEQASLSYGLESEVLDPTTSARAFQRLLSSNILYRVKGSKWHRVKEQGSGGKTGWKYYVLAHIPVDEIEKSFQSAIAKEREKAKQAEMKALDAHKKSQAEKAAQFWEKMETQDFIE